MPRYQHGHDLTLGTIAGTDTKLVLPRLIRSMHMYIPGSTGVGKSKLLEHMIRQHIRDWPRHRCGMILLDPHGSVTDTVLAWCARHRLNRPIVPIDLRKGDWVLGYNVLRHRPAASSSVVIDALVQAMAYVWGASGTDQTPLLARWAANVFQALYERNLTLVEAIPLLRDQAVQAALTSNIEDPLTGADWKRAAGLSQKDFEAQLGSTMNRLQRFLRNESMRLIFGQNHASLDLRSALDDGAIILASLATEGSVVSKENADLYGTLLLTDLVESARERGKRDGLRPFYVFMDEAQRFVTPSIAESLDEARGFGLHFTIANQFPGQFLDRGDAGKQLYNSVMENASSKAVFRLSHEDNLRPLAQWLYRGVMNPDEVKLAMYSTKVMGYREELRTSRSWNESSSRGGGSSRTSGSGSGRGRSVRMTDVDDDEAGSESTNESSNETDSDSESWSDSSGWSESEQTVLIPELGKELSHVQYRSLDEQMFRSMAALFDQQQRHCVVRLAGMKAPVSLQVPHVKSAVIPPKRVEQYRQELLAKLPYAVTQGEALRRMIEREKTLLNEIVVDDGSDADEPILLRRKVPESC